jgi:hypothetical protein
MYKTVPISIPCWVMLASSAARAMPKSRSFRLPFQSGAELERDPEAFLVAKALVLDDLVEGPTLEILHRDVRGAFEAIVFEDRRDVRVVELGGVLGLAMESLVRLGIDLRVLAENLQCDSSP